VLWNFSELYIGFYPHPEKQAWARLRFTSVLSC
jgi:hypothetical protein